LSTQNTKSRNKWIAINCKSRNRGT